MLQDLEWDCLIWFRGRQLPPSLPRYSNDSKGPRVAAGISDPRAEISGIIVMVRRSGDKSRGTATGFFFFFFGCLFAFFSLACFSFPTEATGGHCNLTLPRQSSLHQHHKGLTGILYCIRFYTIRIKFLLVISTLYKTEWLRQD